MGITKYKKRKDTPMQDMIIDKLNISGNQSDSHSNSNENCTLIDHILMTKQSTLFKKRIFDILFSAMGLICLLPFFILIAILIKVDSSGPILYKQTRIGKSGKEFEIYKFRKMRADIGDQGLKITTTNDVRMTKFGKTMKKYKIDELPQLWNVFRGDMSFVGPRPETPNYVEIYDEMQRDILKIKPGITDYASLEYINEGDLLESSPDPDKLYRETLIPKKIEYNLQYIKDMSIKTDLKIIFSTLWETIRQAGDKDEGGNISRR